MRHLWGRLIWIMLAIIVAIVAWFAAARFTSLFVDTLTTEEIGSSNPGGIVWNGSFLQIGPRMLGVEGLDNKVVLNLDVDSAGRLIASMDRRTLVLGPRGGSAPSAGEQAPIFAGETGDQIRFTLSRSRLSWPSLFDFNFMTGNSPSWKRFVYYRLVWKKPSGATLDLLWRFEQWYYASEGRWMDADMTGADSCGLVRVSLKNGK